jgi:alkanesulfonate monooxygenase SsuD/methylene tetrahydromethanopterin reductase-like flavin-dependent oxidoreductase (luciferase family)
VAASEVLIEQAHARRVIIRRSASLDVISGGRFELGLGAGAFWEAVGAMGGPTRSPGEAVDTLGEAIDHAEWRPSESRKAR